MLVFSFVAYGSVIHVVSYCSQMLDMLNIFLGRLFDRVDLIKLVSNVSPSVHSSVHMYVRACVCPFVHKKFFQFQ